MQRIAMISEHASPLASIGSVDSGGQNVYVAHLARQLGKSGYLVDVFTRRDKARCCRTTSWHSRPRVRVIPRAGHGPAVIPSQASSFRPYMAAFGDFAWVDFMRRDDATGYDVLHANFFMSGVAAMRARQVLDIPLVMTFHALGKVRDGSIRAAPTAFRTNRFKR
ncbi:glycosyltransferase [Cupriavidus basilensis]